MSHLVKKNCRSAVIKTVNENNKGDVYLTFSNIEYRMFYMRLSENIVSVTANRMNELIDNYYLVLKKKILELRSLTCINIADLRPSICSRTKLDTHGNTRFFFYCRR